MKDKLPSLRNRLIEIRERLQELRLMEEQIDYEIKMRENDRS